MKPAAHRALARTIAQHRRKAGLTQAAVARALGEPRAWVARIESGRRRIDVVEYLALAEAIGFDPTKALAPLERARR
jgi:transcriptional regulator with XRE-family HTH domain